MAHMQAERRKISPTQNEMRSGVQRTSAAPATTFGSDDLLSQLSKAALKGLNLEGPAKSQQTAQKKSAGKVKTSASARGAASGAEGRDGFKPSAGALANLDAVLNKFRKPKVAAAPKEKAVQTAPEQQVARTAKPAVALKAPEPDALAASLLKDLESRQAPPSQVEPAPQTVLSLAETALASLLDASQDTPATPARRGAQTTRTVPSARLQAARAPEAHKATAEVPAEDLAMSLFASSTDVTPSPTEVRESEPKQRRKSPAPRAASVATGNEGDTLPFDDLLSSALAATGQAPATKPAVQLKQAEDTSSKPGVSPAGPDVVPAEALLAAALNLVMDEGKAQKSSHKATTRAPAAAPKTVSRAADPKAQPADVELAMSLFASLAPQPPKPTKADVSPAVEQTKPAVAAASVASTPEATEDLLRGLLKSEHEIAPKPAPVPAKDASSAAVPKPVTAAPTLRSSQAAEEPAVRASSAAAVSAEAPAQQPLAAPEKAYSPASVTAFHSRSARSDDELEKDDEVDMQRMLAALQAMGSEQGRSSVGEPAMARGPELKTIQRRRRGQPGRESMTFEVEHRPSSAVRDAAQMRKTLLREPVVQEAFRMMMAAKKIEQGPEHASMVKRSLARVRRLLSELDTRVEAVLSGSMARPFAR